MRKPSYTPVTSPYASTLASYAKDASSAPTSLISGATIPTSSTTTRTGRPSLLGGV